MDFFYSALVFLHMIGLAGIVAGFLMQVITGHAKSGKVLLHSSLLQLLSGLAIVAVAEMSGDADLDHVKVAVKLLVALAVVVLGILNLRTPSNRLAVAAGVLAVVNIGVAVFM